MSTIFSWLKRFGELRDGLLVIAGILYIVGYLTWAINAWQYNLGLLPALESQYFLAGIGPALTLAVSYFVVRGLFLLRKKVAAYLEPGVTGWKLLLRRTLFAFCVSAYLSLNYLVLSQIPPEAGHRVPFAGHRVALILVSVSWVLSLFFLPPFKRASLLRNLVTSLFTYTLYSLAFNNPNFWGAPFSRRTLVSHYTSGVWGPSSTLCLLGPSKSAGVN